MDSEVFRAAILCAQIQPNAAKLIGRRFILQMDNDPKHKAKATQEFIKAKKWNILEWPKNSPGLTALTVKNLFLYSSKAEAISSLKKYPLPLQNGKEAKILQNFGDGICKMLDQRLEKHYAEHGPNASIHSLSNNCEKNRTQKKASAPLPTPYADLPIDPQEGPSPTNEGLQ
ncbi:unnamed protein product [Ranitomeya imitator]|uniref:Crossover junction endonuclease MUS81-like HHH domain-containing protein n=1 Tax=Ranitomeya imitator TaxID=111125 RepID=A0ABN9LF65_9NEOB|nr:unnamed protein product [Ranitomeya imitator]